MNEMERRDRRLRSQRNAYIAMSLAALAAMVGFATVYDDDRTGLVFGVISLILAGDAWVPAMALRDHRAPQLWRDTAGVSPVIAVILMVGITVVLAATVFVLVADLGEVNDFPPSIGFTSDSVEDTLTVVSVNRPDVYWRDLQVQGCTPPDGNESVDPGDQLTQCTGHVRISHRPSATLIYQARFNE